MAFKFLSEDELEEIGYDLDVVVENVSEHNWYSPYQDDELTEVEIAELVGLFKAKFIDADIEAEHDYKQTLIKVNNNYKARFVFSYLHYIDSK